MKKDRYKEQFSGSIATAFRDLFPDQYAQVGSSELFDPEFIYKQLEAPKDPTMGRFALPVFRYAKQFKLSPPDLASKIAETSNPILKAFGSEQLVQSSSASGFINAQVDPLKLTAETLTNIISNDKNYGNSTIGDGKRYLVEYSSPNIAKPFGVGHLRTTVLGNSLRLIYKKLGYDVIGINYPGDWGTQFGKMIVAFNKWGDESELKRGAVKYLLSLYVKFHKEVEENPALDDEARAAFKQLEDGETEAVRLWEKFKEISNAEFERVYSLLGVEFDLVYGESYLNDKMEAAIERFDKAKLTSISESALVVHLKDEKLPPLLLKKADGATLYATRDLAGLIYRWKEYPFYESLYVVNSAQSDHFKQCFGAIELLEEAEGLPAEKKMTGHVVHVDFGWVRFGGKGMSTRQGNIVLLDDVIDEASKLVKEKIIEKNPDLPEIEKTSLMVGVGAVIFSQLSVRRQKDVDFTWENVLNFEGETGPYLQYTHARLCSLIRKYNCRISMEPDFTQLVEAEEQRLIENLADFPQVVIDAGRLYDPSFIAGHLLKLAGAFNRLYQRKREDGSVDRIISEDKKQTDARMALVKAVQIVLNEGLALLGLSSPEEM